MAAFDDGAHIDAMADAGMDPADECEATWVADRYDGFVATATGYVLARANYDDERLRLVVTTTSGCVRAELDFGLDDLGLAMFVAAATAAQAVDA